MFTLGLAGGAHGFDPLILLLLTLTIEAYVGDARPVFRIVPHPVALIGRGTGWLEARLNREHRSQADRAMRGALVVIVVAGLCLAIGWAVAWLTRNHDFGVVVELILLVTLLGQRGLYDHVRAVGVALRNQGLEQGRAAVAHIVGRDPTRLDAHGVARAALESCAENFCDGVVAPVFWYVLFGFPGLLAYKAVNTMDSMLGYKTPRYRAFGFTAARLDDVLNIIPARLSGLFLVVASVFVPTANPWRALKAMLRDAGKHRSVNAGWPEAAMAGALDLALAGPRAYSQATVNDAWMGSGRARVDPRDIRRGLYLYAVACLINAMWVAALVLVRLAMSV